MNNSNNIDLTIIVLNYNTKSLLKRCIESILKHLDNLNYELIIVDNRSTDGSKSLIQFLAKKEKKIKAVFNDKNLGFAGGNNKGLKIAQGRYILLLNSDILINNNIFKGIIEWMDNLPAVGAMTCKLVNTDGSIQGNGGYFPTLFRVFCWMFFIDDIPYIDKLIKPFHPLHSKSFYKNTKYYETQREMDWLTGAFYLFRKEVFDRVGYLDDEYFMYTEDVDYSKRVNKLDYKLIYNPKWTVTHLGSASSTSDFPIIQEIKGIKIYFKKYGNRVENTFLRIILKLGVILRIVIFKIFDLRMSENYVKAYKSI